MAGCAQRVGLHLHRVPIVEIMAPFIRRDLLDRAMPFVTGIRSGYGLDRFALPLAAADLGVWRFAAVDLAAMSHVRPLASVQRRFSNGLLSKEEELLVRMRLMRAMGFTVNEPLRGAMEMLWRPRKAGRALLASGNRLNRCFRLAPILRHALIH